jgi:hypothetical protein
MKVFQLKSPEFGRRVSRKDGFSSKNSQKLRPKLAKIDGNFPNLTFWLINFCPGEEPVVGKVLARESRSLVQ